MNPYRQEALSQFLDKLKKLYAQNPNLEVLDDTIYDELTAFDCQEDYNDDLKCKFPKWERFFKNSNLAVFNHPEQRRFLQFHNSCGKASDDYNEYKLYLNVPGFYIDEAVKKIFGFISKMNIETYSKVADYVRSDVIVLRLPNKDDMVTVMNFINNDVMLKRYARRTNPFLASFGVVGTAYDKLESYNGTISKLLTQYFRERRKNGELNLVDLKDFQDFILNLQRTIFTDHQAMMEFFNQQDYAVFRRRHDSKEEQILNYKEIIDLIAINITRDIGLGEYINLVETYRNPEWERQELERIGQVYADRQMQPVAPPAQAEPYSGGYGQTITYQPQGPSLQQDIVSPKKALIDEYIKYAINKYGVQKALGYMTHYMRGNIEGITRDNNFRGRFEREITPDDVLEVANYDTSLYYARMYILNHTYKYNVVVDALLATYRIYNYEQLSQAVVSALGGEYKYITSDGANQYRERLYEVCKPRDIRNVMEAFLMSHNIPFTEYNLASVFASSLSNEKDLTGSKTM